MEATSVLAFIVPRLTNQVENAVTDCLQFILSKHARVANAFRAYLRTAGVELPDSLEFTTQVHWHDLGVRPDLSGVSGGETFVVLEAKFYAPLTKGQPVGYLPCLPTKGKGILIFVAPGSRIDEVWGELEGRCFSSRIPLGDRVQHQDGLSSASLQSAHRLAITSWESLLKVLEQSVTPGNDAHADLLQLCALCDRVLRGELPSVVHVADGGGPEAHRQLKEMVDAIASGLIAEGIADTKGYRATPGPGYYKRYMTLAGRVNWCVEFNQEYWARFGESQIWLSGDLKSMSPSDVDSLDAMLLERVPRLYHQYLIPLRNSARSESEAFRHMLKQALTVARRLASTQAL